MFSIIFKLIFCHLVGDYVLQSEFIANTKGKNMYHMVVHCLLYILPFFICFGFNWKLLFLLSIHFIVDSLKARFDKISYWQDQTLHYLALIVYLL